jgi:dihydroxy-acid dehydratase
MAMGGSTNAVIHLIAIARRAGVPLTLGRFDEIARVVPVLADVRPSGAYLMEDFHYAGGILGLLSRLVPHLELGCATVAGTSLGAALEGARVHDAKVIRPLAEPVAREACAVLKGSLAPDGAVIKPSAADPRLLRHTGPALAFESYADLAAAIERPDLAVTPATVLVLKNAGPVGGPGMPEWGMLPIPTRLLRQGVRDLLRISDARMSGTSYGACVLHVAPEAAVGGPLALVRSGDAIAIDVAARRLDLLVEPDELARRRALWRPPAAPARGWERMFRHHVRQASEGCDLDWLEGSARLAEPEIH